MGELWYKSVAYNDAKDLVKENLVNTVVAFIASGYWLKMIRDSRGYEQDGYRTVWECAEAEFGLKISEASRAMGMNDKYSVGGNSPFMDEAYMQYNKSQLQEMLTLPENQISQVTPDMTVREIRKIKNQGKQRLEDFLQCFASERYLWLRRMYSEQEGLSINGIEECDRIVRLCGCGDSLDLGEGACTLIDNGTGEIIGEYGTADVFCILTEAFLAVAEEKQKRLLPEAKGTTGHPYCRACGALLVQPEWKGMCHECPGCGQAVDWVAWIYERAGMPEEPFATPQVQVITCADVELQEDIGWDGTFPEQEGIDVEFDIDIDGLLQRQDDVVDAEYIEVNGLEEEAEPEEEAEEEKQDELPIFRNDTERKAWISDVEAWGLWYEDSNIDARYYKYDFPDGSRVVAVKYRYTCPPWISDRECRELDGSFRNVHYHMIYSDEYKKNNQYAYERYYVHATASITELVKFIKEMSKKGVGHE